MGDVREQAAAAALAWAKTHGSTTCKDYDGQIACAAGYILGHAAGVEEGARRGCLLQPSAGACAHRQMTCDKADTVCSWASLAPGTGLATGEGQKEEG